MWLDRGAAVSLSLISIVLKTNKNNIEPVTQLSRVACFIKLAQHEDLRNKTVHQTEQPCTFHFLHPRAL